MSDTDNQLENTTLTSLKNEYQELLVNRTELEQEVTYIQNRLEQIQKSRQQNQNHQERCKSTVINANQLVTFTRRAQQLENDEQQNQNDLADFQQQLTINNALLQVKAQQIEQLQGQWPTPVSLYTYSAA